MGMAASQARFLALTARKTNVEYEGQQVNQQRTALANQSAGLYNQMLALTVPTPPSAVDYYSMRYSYAQNGQEFEITNYTQNADGTYNVSVRTAYDVINYEALTINADSTTNITQTLYKQIDKEGNISYYMRYGTSSTQYALMGPNANEAIAEQMGVPSSNKYYSYDRDGTTYYLEANTVAGLAEEMGYSGEMAAYKKLSSKNVVDSIYENSKLLADATGRFSYITLPDGTQYQLTLDQVSDDSGYDEAMQKYNYDKMVYEKTIQDINAKTEKLQAEDRTLELRLKQLDTEQNALKTEMDAVKSVIKDNVEKTFNTFG